MRRCRNAHDGASSRDVLVLTASFPLLRRFFGNHEMTFSRRDFLAASVAAMAFPGAARAAAVPLPKEAEIVVVGAGAAGIAAARRVLGANRKVVVVEASNRIGGRCWTDTETFGVPFDRGARWIYAQNANPVARLARSVAMDVYAAPQAQKIRIGRRNARAGETEDFLATLVRTNRALGDPNRKARPAGAGRDAEGHRRLGEDAGIQPRARDCVQGPEGGLGAGPVAPRAARCRRVLPAGSWRAGGEARGARADRGRPARRAHRLERARSRRRNRERPHRHARHHRHRVDECADVRKDQVRAGPAEAALGRGGKALARQLRSHRAGASEQSARPAARRLHRREERHEQDGAAAGQCRATRRSASSTSAAALDAT